MDTMFDCIIVGAGPAGASAAYHLAKQGHSVSVLEKSSIGRSKPCGGGVSPAIAQWFDFDFTPVIDNTVSKVYYTWKMGDPVEAELGDVKPMWMVKRDAFDNFLIAEVKKQGVEVKDNTEVTAIESLADGWVVKTADGSFTARYLIVADGASAPISSTIGFNSPQQFTAASLDVETEVPADKRHVASFDFGTLKNGFIWNFPKSNGYSISAAFMRGNKGKPEELKKQLNNYAEKFGIDLAKSQYCESSIALWTENKTLHSDRALLAGEAAGILDPLTGEGIRPAIFTGVKAADAIHSALAGSADALAQYTTTISEEWGADMTLANRLAGLFYKIPGVAYKVAVKQPAAAEIMGKILCGELRYSDVTERAMKRLNPLKR